MEEVFYEKIYIFCDSIVYCQYREYFRPVI
jgi:hypothetical protein